MTRKLVAFGMTVLLLFACRPQDIAITVRFERLSGLAANDRVLFENNAAGEVQAIRYNGNGSYAVAVRIDGGFANAVTEYARFEMHDDAGRPNRKAIVIVLTRQGGTPLADGAVVDGYSPPELFGERFNQDLREGFDAFKKQLESLADDFKQIPESDAFQDLKRSMGELADELSQTEKSVRRKLKNEWLPRIEQELEALRKRLEDSGRQDETEPLENELERIRRI